MRGLSRILRTNWIAKPLPFGKFDLDFALQIDDLNRRRALESKILDERPRQATESICPVYAGSGDNQLKTDHMEDW